jgi:hypothetical protein
LKPVLHYESEDFNSANPTTSSNSSSGFKTELGFDGRPVFEASALKLPFIEEALAAGANLHHISFQHHNSDWTVVSFTNAKGTYLVNGDDVYVTQASVQQAQAAIERDPATLRCGMALLHEPE